MKTLYTAVLYALLALPSFAQLPVVPIKSTVYQGFLVEVDSTANERWIDNSIVSGMADRVNGIETIANTASATADEAKTLASAAQDSAYNAHSRADEAYRKASRTQDFAGKTLARVMRARAMEYVIWLAGDSTVSDTIKVLGAKLEASKRPKLSNDEEELIAMLYLDYLQSGAQFAASQAADPDAPTLEALERLVSQLQVNMDELRLDLAHKDEAQDARLNDVEATQLLAFGPESPTAASVAAVPEDLREGAMATRHAVEKNLKWAARELEKLGTAAQTTDDSH